MTSPLARYRQLSDETMLLYAELCVDSDIALRVSFFCSFLRDVAPLGLIVSFIPVTPEARAQNLVIREEIILMTGSGKIFMSGLVSSVDEGESLERTAGDEAYTHWGNGNFVFDGENWRFFTGHGDTIEFFGSRDRHEWESEDEFRLIAQAWDVADFLQEEYDDLKDRAFPPYMRE